MNSPRLRRLETDFTALEEAFGSDPNVSITPSGPAKPPEAYDITFGLRGLRRVGDHPQYVDSHKVQIRLPVNYPSDQPYCVPVTPVFHPNVEDYFCIADHWSPDTSLVDVVVKLGNMIQWRDYNIDSPLDADAAKWARDHDSADFLPIGKVDIRPRSREAEINVGPEVTASGPADRGEPDSADEVVITVRTTDAPS